MSRSSEIAGAYEVLSSPFCPPGPVVLPVLSSDRLHVDSILTYSRTFAMVLTFAARAVGAPVITLAAATLASGWAHASAKVLVRGEGVSFAAQITGLQRQAGSR